MFRTAFVVLATMACAQARPRSVPFQNPQASGQSGSGITKGETHTPFGSNTVTQHNSQTGGQASGGGTNFGHSGTNQQNLNTPHGQSSTSDTDAQSVQTSGPGGVPVGGGGGGPVYRCLPPSHGGGNQFVPFPHGGGGAATGQSGSGITQGETQTQFGTNTVTQQNSQTGGQASGGGVNVGHAHSNLQNLNTPHGSHSTSDTGAESSQFSNPGFHGGAFQGLRGMAGVRPRANQVQFPGFHGGSSTGHSGGNIVSGETVGPHGVQSTQQHQSLTGGSASGGGTNFGTAHTGSQSEAGRHGTSTSSDTGAQSVQTSNPGGFPNVIYRNCGGGGGGGGFPGGFGGRRFGFGGQGSASGQSGSGITSGHTVGHDGSLHTVQQHNAATGGHASHGGSNVGRSSADSQRLRNQHGTSQNSNTDAQSTQFGGGAGFPPLLHRPPGFRGFGRASGTADSGLTQGETIRADGSTHKVTSLGSSAGGNAQDGGSSHGRSSGRTASTDGLHGSHSESHVDAESVQTSGR